MYSKRADLLEQILTTIKRNAADTNGRHSNPVCTAEEPAYPQLSVYENQFTTARREDSIKKLEQRIEVLESQNDNLLYFVHYLYKNFSELMKDYMPHLNREQQLTGLTVPLPENECGEKFEPPSLTRREIEILHLLVKGLCAKEIAGVLFISETTVITHKKNLKRKFNAKNSVELMSKAFSVLFKVRNPAV
jgi:DNA-binding NarL/FixJ family response regulator